MSRPSFQFELQVRTASNEKDFSSLRNLDVTRHTVVRISRARLIGDDMTTTLEENFWTGRPTARTRV